MGLRPALEPEPLSSGGSCCGKSPPLARARSLGLVKGHPGHRGSRRKRRAALGARLGVVGRVGAAHGAGPAAGPRQQVVEPPALVAHIASEASRQRRHPPRMAALDGTAHSVYSYLTRLRGRAGALCRERTRGRALRPRRARTIASASCHAAPFPPTARAP